MTKRRAVSKVVFATLLMAVFAISLLSASVSRSAQPPQPGCGNVTDAEIIATIKDKIKNDRLHRFDSQLKHINVDSRSKVVTLDGFVIGRAQVRAVGNFASTTRCVRRVVNRLKDRFIVGCGAGTKLCGDICIPRTAACTIE
jgi:hypothetical protein